MPDKYHALRCIMIVALFWGIAVGVTSSEKPAPADQALEAIRYCMARSPAPWPDEWKQEYIDTIRKAISTHQDTPQYNLKVEILGKGFKGETRDSHLFITR